MRWTATAVVTLLDCDSCNKLEQPCRQVGKLGDAPIQVLRNKSCESDIASILHNAASMEQYSLDHMLSQH